MLHFMNSIEMGTVWLCAYLLILAYELFMVYLINFCSQRNFSYFSFRQSVQPEHGQMNEPRANDNACGHVSIKRGAQLDQPCLSLSYVEASQMQAKWNIQSNRHIERQTG